VRHSSCREIWSPHYKSEATFESSKLSFSFVTFHFTMVTLFVVMSNMLAFWRAISHWYLPWNNWPTRFQIWQGTKSAFLPFGSLVWEQ